MGYHIILNCTAQMKPEFIAFLKKHDEILHGASYDYMLDEVLLPEEWEIYCKWHEFPIHTYYYEWDITDNIWTFRIEIRPYHRRACRHHCSFSLYVKDDYMKFMRTIVAENAIEVTKCIIEEDDYGDSSDAYTDEEVRNFHISTCYRHKIE